MLRVMVLANCPFDRIMLCCLIDRIRPVDLVLVTDSKDVAVRALHASPRLDLLLASGQPDRVLVELKAAKGDRHTLIHDLRAEEAQTEIQMRQLKAQLGRVLSGLVAAEEGLSA